ncbi:hypothetical protein LVB87_04335 [Lysobacter sp. KIS68-7]|uniref:hypothetical protein n=1 Tax=Lysobacter sp. KIS68-7 TaxID=2904252 RepID=UPI001E5470AA|nr:hypothetical protein [Lysobacter sp. KIS68-7]UHQ20396.1 hypothetical protein LVB87_04335 [Lysobacter sp. KIS68-7]
MPLTTRPAPVVRLTLAGALACATLLAACQRSAPAVPGGDRPTQAVLELAQRLRSNDAKGFATVAVPPDLHARLETAWRTGRSRWPLDELPLEDRLPAMLAALSADDARTSLQKTFDHQFANAGEDLRSAATSLGVFGVEYIRKEGHYSAAERDHYTQSVAAMSRWAANAPLSDPRRARGAIALLTTAARRTGIASADDLANLGLDESLERLGPFLAASKQVFASYGLDLDATLGGLQATLVQQTGDVATVRLRYTLGTQVVDTMLEVQRIDGRWYLEDYLRNAEASLDGPGARAQSAPAAVSASPSAGNGAASP